MCYEQEEMEKSLEITEIKHQSLGLPLADFLICDYCRIVDRDRDRIKVGHPCSNCGTPSPSGSVYFNISVHSLIDLMQEFFHKDQTEESLPTNGLRNQASSRRNSKVAVIIFFVTLREVLFENFLYDLMIAQNLPAKVCNRLFDDNLGHAQRIKKLFPSLAGVTWKIAVKTINNKCKLDYIELDSFIKKTVEARNRFLHEGGKWAITEKMAEECLRHIWPLLNLHVYLHNEYVVPYYAKG
jgi:hypothetical protein